MYSGCIKALLLLADSAADTLRLHSSKALLLLADTAPDTLRLYSSKALLLLADTAADTPAQDFALLTVSHEVASTAAGMLTYAGVR